MSDAKILDLQDSLLTSNDAFIPNPSTPIEHLIRSTAQGAYRDVLLSPELKDLDLFHIDESGNPKVDVGKLSSRDDVDLLLFAVGVSLLQAFVQANWTGPDLDFSPVDLFSKFGDQGPSTSTSSSKREEEEIRLNAASLTLLSLGGEPAYHLCKDATLLLLAREIFGLDDGKRDISPLASSSRLETLPIWNLRLSLVHIRILDEPIEIPSSILSAAENLLSNYTTLPSSSSQLRLPLHEDRATSLSLLIGSYHSLLSSRIHSSRSEALMCYKRAAEIAGLEWEMTGRRGKMTRFQTEDKTLLVVLARGRNRERRGVDGGEEQKKGGEVDLPKTLNLGDDTLLEKAQYTPSVNGSTTNGTTSTETDSKEGFQSMSADQQPKLHPLDQSILLALSTSLSPTAPQTAASTSVNPNTDVLTASEISSFVNRVVEQPSNWSVHSMALLLRSRLESGRTRTVERGVMQLASLVEQFRLATEDSVESGQADARGPTGEKGANVSERLRYFYDLGIPPTWEMEKELANRWMALGMIKSALEIFERLEMWEEVVSCWAVMERKDKGIEIVRDLLEGKRIESDDAMRVKKADTGGSTSWERKRQAKLWCLLGELESEPEHYRKAWEISDHTSSRAMRGLGGFAFVKGRYGEAIEHLQSALKINPLYTRTWFILGCAAMRERNWTVAEEAFVRCVSLDDEDAESWNNLASVHLRMGDDDENDLTVTKAKTLVVDVDEAEDGEPETNRDASYSRKRSAFSCLRQATRQNYDNWRIWMNYMIVAVDVGEMSEACRALGRIVEMRSESQGEDSVDLDVLERLVNAVVRSHGEAEEESRNEAGDHDPNSGKGLFPRVLDLFTRTLLPRVSTSSRIYQAYARLLLWSGDLRASLEANLTAYRVGVATEPKVEFDALKFREAARLIEETVDALTNLGPREVKGEDGGKELVLKEWKFQARSILRSFLGRTKDAFEDEPEYDRVKEILDDLKNQ